MDRTGLGSQRLVRSTDFLYSDQAAPADPRNPIYTFMQSVTHTGYRRTPSGIEQRSMPPLELTYSRPEVHPDILTLTEADSRANTPEGVDGTRFRMADLDGEGLAGILTEQNGGWGYKRNLSSIRVTLPDGEQATRARFGPLEQVPSLPVPANLGGGQQLLDLTGSGRLDLVAFDGPTPGYFARSADEDWAPLQTFRSIPRVNWSEPNLKFVDLTGDGLADVLITGMTSTPSIRHLAATVSAKRNVSSPRWTRSAGHMSCSPTAHNRSRSRICPATASAIWCAFATAMCATGPASVTADSARRSRWTTRPG